MVDPKQIDKEIAETEFQLSSITLRINNVESTIKHYREQAVKYPHYTSRADEQLLVRNALLEERIPMVEKVRSLNAQYTGWTRAFLVVNSNGHIHKNRSCSSCFLTTQYYWVTELSGDDEITIIEKAGEKACTICYPDAPADFLKLKSQIEHPDNVRAREEREAKRLAKEEKFRRVGIWNADNTPLKVYESPWSSYRYEVKTERTAVQIALSHGVWLADKERERKPEEKARVIESLALIYEALAVKHDTNFDIEREAIELKVQKQVEKNEKATAKWFAEHPEYQR